MNNIWIGAIITTIITVAITLTSIILRVLCMIKANRQTCKLFDNGNICKKTYVAQCETNVFDTIYHCSFAIIGASLSTTGWFMSTIRSGVMCPIFVIAGCSVLVYAIYRNINDEKELDKLIKFVKVSRTKGLGIHFEENRSIKHKTSMLKEFKRRKFVRKVNKVSSVIKKLFGKNPNKLKMCKERSDNNGDELGKINIRKIKQTKSYTEYTFE